MVPGESVAEMKEYPVGSGTETWVTTHSHCNLAATSCIWTPKPFGARWRMAQLRWRPWLQRLMGFLLRDLLVHVGEFLIEGAWGFGVAQ